MYKVLFNTYSGLKKPVLDFKETKKRIKVVDLDGSYSLWHKDSYDAKMHILMEGKDQEEVDKKIDDYVINNINSEFNKLLQLINFETLASLIIEVSSYKTTFSWRNFGGTGDYEIFKINIPDTKASSQESGKYHKIISNLVNRHIASRKEIYKKKYRTHSNKLVKVIDSPNYVYKPFDGLYIHKDNIVDRLPDEPIYTGKRYAIGSYNDGLSIYIPNKCEPGSSSRFFNDEDMERIPFSVDELSEIKKSIKIVNNDDPDIITDSIEGIIVIKNTIFICKKTPSDKYEYEEISKGITVFKFVDKISTLKNNKKTFQFITSDGNFRIYGSEDFIFEELLLVENRSSMYGKFLKFKSIDGYTLRENSDYLMEVSHSLPILLSEMKKQLGQSYNTWMLMNDVQ